MKDEIKEILERPNVYSFNDECYLYFGDYNKLKDYITNLQEERDMYKGSFETMSKNYFEEKAKTDKAIETIELWDMCGSELITTFQEKAINILQGSDE